MNGCSKSSVEKREIFETYARDQFDQGHQCRRDGAGDGERDY